VSAHAGRRENAYIEAMTTPVSLAEVAALVGDPARANILCALLDGRALTAGELAYAANVSPQTTSGHLAKLTQAHLLDVLKQGRHRYFRIATPQVAQMLESIMVVALQTPPRHRPASRVDEAMCIARTCYDHFAGRLGVGLADTLCGRGHVVLGEDGGEVTPQGHEFFERFGVALVKNRRRIFCRACVDWTERRPHLGGAVGAALATRCFDLGWVKRMREGRALWITPVGRTGLREVFDLSM
jgi:DNA-binding transcriptional ArsR family regulator